MIPLKKPLVALLALVLVFCLSACSSGSKPPSAQSQEGSPSSSLPASEAEASLPAPHLALGCDAAIAMEVGQSLEVSLTAEGQAPDLTSIQFFTSDPHILTFEASQGSGALAGIVSAESEGVAEIYVAASGEQSSSVTVTVTDPARLAAEEQARLAAEEQARLAAEEETESQGQVIYITPTGTRYHYDSHCNGGTYIPSTLEEALARGLTPCKKCAGG